MRHEKGTAERAASVVRCQKFASICTVLKHVDTRIQRWSSVVFYDVAFWKVTMEEVSSPKLWRGGVAVAVNLAFPNQTPG